LGVVEIGLGIHGERGKEQRPFISASDTVQVLFEQLCVVKSPASEMAANESKTRGDGEQDGEQVVLFVNNLGSTTELEMNLIVRECLEESDRRKLRVVLVGSGRCMTALEMHGFSVTLLRLKEESQCQHVLKLLLPDRPEAIAPLLRFTIPQQMICTDSLTPSITELAAALRGTHPHEDVELSRIMRSIFTGILAEKERLNDLDAAVGDGDTGFGAARAANAALQIIDTLPWSVDALIPDCLRVLAKAVADSFAGSSGPLYGAFLVAASNEARSKRGVELLKSATEVGAAAIANLGNARRGDRTMLDVFLAVCDSQSFQRSSTVQEALQNAAEVASKASIEVSLMKAKRGRSRYMDGKEIGNLDPGAELVSIWIRLANDALRVK
jgi:dihydroxyacetone kinase